MSTARGGIELTDPRALRALAHPIRLRIVGLLRRQGPLTATRAAELLGESSASCSFHLRQLAKYGLVEEAGGGSGRQRPWRATSWPVLADTAELREATGALSSVIAEFYVAAMLRWIDTRDAEPAEWVHAAPFGDQMLYLTADELTELAARVDELLAGYRPRTADPALRPDGARGVMYLNVAVPSPGNPATP